MFVWFVDAVCFVWVALLILGVVLMTGGGDPNDTTDPGTRGLNKP